MMNVQIVDYSTLIAFWLVFTRLMAIIFQLPLFDNQAVPGIVKVLATLVITFAFYPYVESHVLFDVKQIGVSNFWWLTICNVAIGLILGLFVKSIMNIFISAGSIITQEVGFSAINYFDPNAEQQVGPFEKLIQWSIVILLLSSGALIPMFKGILISFSTMHVHDLGRLLQSHLFFFSFFKGIFISSLLLASPLIFMNLLISSILGIIARMVPQMNVIMVSFVVNIGLGLMVFASISDEFFQVAFKIYTDKLADWIQFIG